MSDIKHEPVKSSNVATVGHDAKTNTLHVQFKNGKSYQYGGVTPDDHAKLMAAESVGKHLNQHIIPHYSVKKASSST